MPMATPEEQREYGRQWIAKRRAEFFADKRCAVWWCGETENLELDHLDPAQKETHAIWSWSQERREVELAKCQVLCVKCHAEKTKQERQEGRLHGTAAGYHRGCKCAPCKAWKSAALKRETRRQPGGRSEVLHSLWSCGQRQIAPT